jgi:hypothetical protein
MIFQGGESWYGTSGWYRNRKIRLDHPCGNPALEAEDEQKWRLELLRAALRALATPVTGPTLFEPAA